MKILMINCLDSRYGAARRARNIRQAVKSLGHEVTYVESNYSDGEAGTISIPQKDTVFGYLFATFCRVRYCLKMDYDLLFIFKLNPLTLPCILAGLARKKKLIVDWDDLDSEFQKNRIRRKMTELIERFIPRHIPFITTHNQILRRYALNRGAREVHIVPQTVDTGLFDPLKYRWEEVRESLGLNGKKVCVFLGTLTKGGAQDLDLIIDGMSEVARVRNDVYLLIIGGGPLQGKFEKMLTVSGLSTHATITGSIPPDEVPRYLAAGDIGIVYMRDNPGNRMRTSLKVLEYLAMNIPVVGRLVGNSAERFGAYIHQSVNGTTCLARGIIQALDSRNSPPARMDGNFLNGFVRENLFDTLKKVLPGY